MYCKRQRYSGGQIHQIFLGSDQRLGALRLPLYVMKVRLGVPVMIRKLETADDRNPQFIQGAPEGSGLAQPAECSYGARRNFTGHHHTRAKDGSLRIVSPDQPFDSRVAVLGARYNDCCRSRQRGHGLAEASKWEDSAAQRVQRVDQYDIAISLQAEVLESVVQQEHAGV